MKHIIELIKNYQSSTMYKVECITLSIFVIINIKKFIFSLIGQTDKNKYIKT